ncbi:MAG: lytic transglycosylase domain-containing protein [Hyphomicrobiaceae bacterium]|nr:lytic transglycosylase domain-containing protein [Hyphomicrobiaceae bacterium]
MHVLSRAPAFHGLLAAPALMVLAAAWPAPAAGPLLPAPSAAPVVKANAARQVPSKPLLAAAEAAREADHVTRFDAAIAPARGHPVSEADGERIRAAIAAHASDAAKARALQDEITDPIGRKLVEWHRLRAGIGGVAEIRTFLDDNPAWPDRALLTQRFEEALYRQADDARAVKQIFAAVEPTTGVGLAALASAHLAEGDAERAKAFAARAWRDYAIPASLEAGFLERFGALLTEADHKLRLDRLLIDEPRWTSERNTRAAMVKRMIPLLSKPEQLKAEARLAVFQRSKQAAKRMAAVPAGTSADWGMAFQRVQLLRRQNKDQDAWKILLSAPTDPAEIVSPDGWWLQRRSAAYDALKAGKPKIAFELVRDAGPLSVNPRNEQTFLAGWLALRHLDDARLAEPFFQENEAGADGPLSRSRALYWLGRTHSALGNKSKAAALFEAAAKYTDTFHGHLARERLGADSPALVLAPPAPPTPEQIGRFNVLDAVRAAVVAGQAGLDRSIVRAFIGQLQRHFDSEAEVAMVAHLAEALGDTQMALRVGKAAIARGLNLVHYSYPIHAFPAYSPLRAPPEPALLLGLARQESEFNGAIISGAGARGILQVMPVTARHICRDYKIKCNIGRLMRDPAYNAMLASAYVGDRMAEVSGSYILALTSYNAGPGRTRQWLREMGDPRDPGVDPIDWIYQIPFEETRDYVQKVLSNVQIYRARLGENGGSIGEDLARARRSPKPAEAP